MDKLRVNRQLVLVDGVGYASVGSTVGCSNGQVAHALQAPVVLIGKPGIGNAIDSFNLSRTYFEANGATVIGAVFNKMPRKVSYHAFDNMKHYIHKFFANELPNIAILGTIPVITDPLTNEELSVDGSCAVSCALKIPTHEKLEMNEVDSKGCARMEQHISAYFDFQCMMNQIKKYHSTCRQ